MKFSEKLRTYSVAEWADRYMSYKKLKNELKRIAAELQRSVRGDASRRSSLSVSTRPGYVPPSLHRSSPPASLPLTAQLEEEEEPLPQVQFASPAPAGTGAVAAAQPEPLQLQQPRSRQSTGRRSGEGTAASGAGTHDGAAAGGRVDSEFMKMLEFELEKVAAHFHEQRSLILDRIAGLEQEVIATEEEEEEQMMMETEAEEGGEEGGGGGGGGGELEEQPEGPYASIKAMTADEERQRQQLQAHRKRLQRLTLALANSVEQLETFVKLNTVALYKILKKRDKVLGTKLQTRDLAEKKKRLVSLAVGDDAKRHIADLYRRAAPEGGGEAADDEEEEEVTFEALLQKERMFQIQPSYAATAYVLGCITVLALNILALSVLPATNPRYSPRVFLSVFPIFRLFLAIDAVVWGAGAAMAVMESFGINYKFMLEIDPNCRVGPATLFTLGSSLTVASTILFIASLLDAKFCIFLYATGVVPSFGGEGFPEGSNLHAYASLKFQAAVSRQWVYGALLVLTHAVILGVPNGIFRNKYKVALLRELWLTMKAGLWLPASVTLAQNILGDVLTSFSKPLADLEYIMCHAYHLVQGFGQAGRRGNDGGSCPTMESTVKPLMLAFPLWVRLVQCLSRLLSDKAKPKQSKVHAANIGKYATGLLVVVCTSVPLAGGASMYLQRFVWVTAYTAATAYMFIWDLVMDWGLVPDPDNFLRRQAMYPRKLYYIAGVVDVGCHQTNSSKYRAMLWVPRLVTDSAGVQEAQEAAEETLVRQITTQASPAMPRVERRQFTMPSPKSPQPFSSSSPRRLLTDGDKAGPHRTDRLSHI
eukprot:GHVU01082709.1.p1 GENE.GHVU01082709.1~~GHVU01082709.1.p1  ORF type:complete len:818 (-),score=226.09 GHVU01082709.1:229-2682(-)